MSYKKYGKKVCAGFARWGADWAGSAFALARRAMTQGRGWRERGAGAFGVNPGGVWRLSVRGA